jgi:nitrite reductase/ring-hydroxylating ferredoxin subunit
MARDKRVICPSAALRDGGSGVVFTLAAAVTGFAVRFQGEVCAFVNRCPHVGTELDWQPGEFFEESGLYLVCSTHGALFEPATGFCVAGPCRGASLETVKVTEQEGQVILDNAANPPTEMP